MTDTSSVPQAIDAERFHELGERVVELANRHLREVAELPMRPNPTPEEARVLTDQPLPQTGTDPDLILDFARDHILTHARGNGHPGFHGWVISPPAHMPVLTEMLSAALNAACGGGEHGAILLEQCVIRWIRQLMGFDQPGAHGILVSGGSMASLTALAAARHRAATRLGWDIRKDGLQGGPRLVLYGGEEVHACVKKSVELMGLGNQALRPVESDLKFHMNLEKLEERIVKDKKNGLDPFCVVASAGTVNTGAVDNLDTLADVAERHGLWLHVDGAYGAFGVLDPKAAPRFSGLTRADSLALDPHKWMAVPIECGCTLVRDGANLRDTFSLIPPYIRIEGNYDSDKIGPPLEYGFQLTRGFRAFKVWATLMHIGRDGLATTVARHNRLARYLRHLVETHADLELLAPVELSIVCFRYAPASLKGDDERLNNLNKSILARLQDDGETYPSQTLLNGKFAIRANIMHYATPEQHVERLVDLVCNAGEEFRRANQ